MPHKQVRTRIAPSPTGFPHIGTIYQALFNYAFAKKHNGAFIVRIEDTDRERYVKGAEEKIFEALDWFSLKESESPRVGGPYGPYRQSERLNIYRKYANELIEKGYAYYCFCSKERLEEVRKKLIAQKKIPMYDRHCRYLSEQEIKEHLGRKTPYVIRLKVPDNEQIIVHDELRGDIVFDSETIDDQILIKSDGFPTYHLAVVVDDHLMKITHIVRGEEWLTSTPKHVLLYNYFNWDIPEFYHTADLRNPDRSKLSKRHGHTNVDWYKENGFLPEAILNYLASLGWSHPEGKEIFSLDEFIKYFDLHSIKVAPPIFDLIKLRWINQQYIQKMTEEKLCKAIIDFYHFDESKKSLVKSLIPYVRTRMETLSDFKILTEHFFKDPKVSLRSEQEKEIAIALEKRLSTLSTWESDAIMNVFRDILKTYNIRMPVLYYLLTGQEKGIPLPESIVLLGREITISRLKKLFER